MVYASSSYYIVDFNGMIIPKKKATKYCTLATYCINHYIPKDYNKSDDNIQLKRCCCRIAEILYGYCKESNEVINSKKELITLFNKNEQIKIQIRNTIILYLQINILQKAE